MGSTIGRPRTLTEGEIQTILAWRVRWLFWRALRKTLKSQRQLARELGVSQATVAYIARTGARYKREAPAARRVPRQGGGR